MLGRRLGVARGVRPCHRLGRGAKGIRRLLLHLEEIILQSGRQIAGPLKLGIGPRGLFLHRLQSTLQVSMRHPQDRQLIAELLVSRQQELLERLSFALHVGTVDRAIAIRLSGARVIAVRRVVVITGREFDGLTGAALARRFDTAGMSAHLQHVKLSLDFLVVAPSLHLLSEAFTVSLELCHLAFQTAELALPISARRLSADPGRVDLPQERGVLGLDA